MPSQEACTYQEIEYSSFVHSMDETEQGIVHLILCYENIFAHNVVYTKIIFPHTLCPFYSGPFQAVV
jgi:hypothetical protein